MDKYEYKIRSEEIKTLIERKKYAEAMEIADNIDWRKVRNINMLCMVSDLYKMNRKYEESKEILLLAYERHPGGRMILYSLCELSIKLDDVVHAVEYYKEFVQTAPRDNGRYVLQYKLYEAQEVTLEERIAVLEELKRREYREKWAYELAYLYHRIGLSTKCVEECDELILWFGEGKYVTKAMELKMLHAPLSTEQQKKYKKITGKAAPATVAPIIDDDLDIEIKPVNVGEYATINLQKELAESMKEVLGEENPSFQEQSTMEYLAVNESYDMDGTEGYESQGQPEMLEGYTGEYDSGEYQVDEYHAIGYDTERFDTEEFSTAGYDTGSYEAGYETGEGYETVEFDINEPQTEYEYIEGGNTSGADIGIGARKGTDLNIPGEFTQEILMNMMQDTGELPEVAQTEEVLPDSEEVFFEDPDTVELPYIEESPKIVKMRESEKIPKIVQGAISDTRPHLSYYTDPEKVTYNTKKKEKNDKNGSEIKNPEEKTIAKVKMPSAESMAHQKNENFDGLLSQEYDGQISLAVSAKDKIEKQITGQMSFNDILLEWERLKKENEEKRAEAVRQRVMEQTGEIFLQFDESRKKGLLEDLDHLAEKELPEVEELEEIKEQTMTEQFSEETQEAVRRAAEPEETVQTTDVEKEETLKEGDEPDEIAGSEEKKDGENSVKEEGSGETEIAKVEESVDGENSTEEEVAAAAQDAVPGEREKDKKERAVKNNKKEEKQEKASRGMTLEEKKLFGPFIQTKTTKEQILDTLDRISLASCTGNVILTGEAGMGSVKLAKNIVKDVQMTDRNFSGRMAKITGQALNHKDIGKTFEKLNNGALIIEGAGELKEATISSMVNFLEQEKQGIIVILEDTKINMNKLLENYKILYQNFNLRIDIEALDNDSLVLFGKRYALEQEHAIDELGVLALYTRIAEMQTSEHSVTTKEVKEIIDEAIYHAGRKNMSHFMDVLFGKRYDDEDMIVLREKDFV